MTTSDNSIRVPLGVLTRPQPGLTRRREPVTLGVPLPKGVAASPSDLAVRGDHGSVALQTRGLDLWPDGSLRWVLLDFTADLTDGVLAPLVLTIGDGAGTVSTPGPIIAVRETADGVHVDTGAATFSFRRGQPFPISNVVLEDGTVAFDAAASGFRVAHRGTTTSFVVAAVSVRERGPLRAEIDVRAVAAGDTALSVQVFARVECFAGTPTCRVSVTVRNPQRATHPRGQWVLGDPQSMLLESVSFVLVLPHDLSGVDVAVEGSGPLEPVDTPFELYQDSSGGDYWNHPCHVNRDGVVPVTFRGYRLRSAAVERLGLRASPTVAGQHRGVPIAVAIPQFWQHCPRAIAVNGRTIEVGLFPRQYGDVHELQGGEQKTHVFVIAFGPDRVSDPPLAWCHDPVRVHPSPEWSCETGAVPFLMPAASDDERYRSLVQAALDAEQGFLAKRERFDEYGWRHFGDLPGDHESAFQPPERPFVSHYNNQYDAVAAFAMHFLRSGDVRWWRLMDELVRHVRDIDIYHTRADKAAYNGGLFWHTQHYMDAGTSTHRTYPKGSSGGGPSCEHNYATGLMLHFFLTGDRASCDAAIGLGRWVIEMDDGRQTVFRWLASGPTGHASATGSADYHGPGRGSANSIIACLVAGRLTGERVFTEKVDELVRRCIHPADDLEARNLLDVERRWYYTVFLQALGVYLHEKAERGEIDEMYSYAQASLLHYARWMAGQEVPYLSRPDVLEFPNETWPAQDLRKSEVFWWAAGHGADNERAQFVERARFFFADATARLTASPKRHLTRPLVLSLRNGIHLSWFEATLAGRRLWPQAGPVAAGSPSSFESQRARAIRRARLVAAGVALLAAALLVVVAL